MHSLNKIPNPTSSVQKFTMNLATEIKVL